MNIPHLMNKWAEVEVEENFGVIIKTAKRLFNLMT